MLVKRVVLGCDHRAYEQKEFLKVYLESLGYRVQDVGSLKGERVDYPDIAVEVCRMVVNERCERGIMLDMTGIGSSMTCNKIRGIRAALCYDLRTVVSSREHTNANVLTVSGPLHGAGELSEMVRVWLETPFKGGRHMVRINKMMSIERGGYR